MPEPLYSEFVSHSELIGMVGARVLTKCPDLAGVEWVIDIVHVPGKGIRFDVIAPAAPTEKR